MKLLLHRLTITLQCWCIQRVPKPTDWGTTYKNIVLNVNRFNEHKNLNSNSYDNQQVGRPLMLADNTPVPMFEARDDDGGIFGDITFEIANFGAGKC